jgi:cell division septum initiation protein DivIVA
MSDKKELIDRLDDLREKLKKGNLGEAGIAGMIASAQRFFDNMDPDDKKTLRNKFNSNMSRFRKRRKALGDAKPGAVPRVKRKKDGPDLTNRASGGVIRRRGGGIAKRGFGIAK